MKDIHQQLQNMRETSKLGDLDRWNRQMVTLQALAKEAGVDLDSDLEASIPLRMMELDLLKNALYQAGRSKHLKAWLRQELLQKTCLGSLQFSIPGVCYD